VATHRCRVNRLVAPGFPFPNFRAALQYPQEEPDALQHGRSPALRTLHCALEDLEEWYPRLYLEPHIVAGAAVMSRHSAPPAAFDVSCEGITSRWLGKDTAFRLLVSWEEETAAKANRLLATMQQKPLVELAALAVAFVLARRLVGLRRLDVNDYGERADYRAPTARCVLEVSGTEDPSELGRRHREKVVQALDNTYGWGACVVVCAFAARGHRIRVSRHDPAEE
jgi:hypothetical protein